MIKGATESEIDRLMRDALPDGEGTEKGEAYQKLMDALSNPRDLVFPFEDYEGTTSERIWEYIKSIFRGQ